MYQFQSTLSVRRATHEFIYLRRTDVISIHALREESDHHNNQNTSHPSKFQSTLSVRRATCCRCGRLTRDGISIHALREESDPHANLRRRRILISIHALREESDACAGYGAGRLCISIHALREESDCTDGQHVSHCGTSILRTSSRVAGFEVKTRYSNHSTKK